MSLLKKENWFVYVLLMVLFPGVFTFVVASDLGFYEKNAWYSKWYYWVLGTVLFIYPAIIMLIVLNISMQIKLCLELGVKGERYYRFPYLWILSLIVPILGWATFLVMLLHIYFYPTVLIYQGKGENLCQRSLS